MWKIRRVSETTVSQSDQSQRLQTRWKTKLTLGVVPSQPLNVFNYILEP